VAGKKTTIAIRAVAQDKASKALKTLQATFNKVAKSLVTADAKVTTSNAKVTKAVKGRISASKRVELALAKQAAGTDKTARKIVALNMRYERSAAKMRALARAGKPIPAGLAKQAVSARAAARALRKLRDQQEKTRRGFKKWGKSLATGVGVGVAAVGVFALFRGMRALSRAMRDGVRKSIEFSKATNEVLTIADRSQFSIEGVKKQTLELSKTYGGTAADQARGLYQAISGGANTSAKATEIMTAANKFAISGVTDVKTAIDGLINATNVYGKSGLTAARASEIMQAGIKQGKTTAAELATELGNVSGIAKNAGISFTEVVSSVAAITTKGVTTSQAVTQLRGAIVALGKGAGPAAKEAKRLFGDEGAFSLAAMRQAGGFVPFLKKIRSNAKFNEKTFFKLFGRVEAVNAAMNLVGTDGGAKFDETLKAVVGSAGDVDEAMQTMMSTFGFQVELSKSLADALKIGFGEAVTGSESAALGVSALNDLMRDMTAFFESPEGREAINEFFADFGESLAHVLVGMQSLEPFVRTMFRMDSKANRAMLVATTNAENSIKTYGGALDEARAKREAFYARAGEDSKKWTLAQHDEFLIVQGEVAGMSRLYASATEEGAKTVKKARAHLKKVTGDEVTILDEFIFKLRNLRKTEKQTDAERDASRKKRIKANKDREASFLSMQETRARAAAKLRKDLAAEAAAETAVEQSRKDADATAERRRKQNNKWIRDRLKFLKKAKEDETRIEEREAKKRERIREREAEKQARKTEQLSSKIQGYFSGAYSAIAGAASESFGQVGEVIDGELKTWNDGFRDFFGNLGKLFLQAAADYVVGLGIKAVADQIAANMAITNAAAEGGAKTLASYAGIPFVGLAIGLGAAAAMVTAALAFKGDTKATGFHTGGLVTGPAGRDRIPAWLSAGEFVLPRTVVDAIRGGRAPSTPGRYADGGMVTAQNGGGGGVNITLASAIPQDRASIRRMVKSVILPELRMINRSGGLGLGGVT